MNYLKNIGKNSKKAFEDLKTIKHDKIKKVLETYNKSLLVNKQKIVRENKKDIKNVKRKHLVDRLVLNEKRIDGIRHSINEISNFGKLSLVFSIGALIAFVLIPFPDFRIYAGPIIASSYLILKAISKTRSFEH